MSRRGVPMMLLRVMKEQGIDPRARFVEAADGWRYGDRNVDVSAPEETAETEDLTRDAIDWVTEQIAAGGEMDPAAAVLELDRDE